MEATTIRWLHISDLHMGCRGKEVWWQVRSEFKESIRKHFQPIDMILVTGDLTFSAQPKEFELFNTFLDELLGWLHAAGQGADPLVIAVPGNHDLAWPAERQLRNFRVLENFWNDPTIPTYDAFAKNFGLNTERPSLILCLAPTLVGSKKNSSLIYEPFEC